MLWFAGFSCLTARSQLFQDSGSLSISSPLHPQQHFCFSHTHKAWTWILWGVKWAELMGYFWHLLQTTKVLHFAPGASLVPQLPRSGDPTKDMIHGARLLPCFLLISWVDILAEWRSALCRARLWPSVPVQNCVPLIFPTVLCHLPTSLTFPGGVAELDFLFAEHICFYITLECRMMTCKTCNNASDYRDDTSSLSSFSYLCYIKRRQHWISW